MKRITRERERERERDKIDRNRSSIEGGRRHRWRVVAWH